MSDAIRKRTYCASTLAKHLILYCTFILFFFGLIVFFFFFFQAEDGIRDGTVTGVQTCALPISLRPRWHRHRAPRRPRRQARPPHRPRCAQPPHRPALRPAALRLPGWRAGGPGDRKSVV